MLHTNHKWKSYQRNCNPSKCNQFMYYWPVYHASKSRSSHLSCLMKIQLILCRSAHLVLGYFRLSSLTTNNCSFWFSHTLALPIVRLCHTRQIHVVWLEWSFSRTPVVKLGKENIFGKWPNSTMVFNAMLSQSSVFPFCLWAQWVSFCISLSKLKFKALLSKNTMW